MKSVILWLMCKCDTKIYLTDFLYCRLKVQTKTKVTTRVTAPNWDILFQNCFFFMFLILNEMWEISEKVVESNINGLFFLHAITT